MRKFSFFLAGKPGRSRQSLDVGNPADSSTVDRTGLARPAEFVSIHR